MLSEMELKDKLRQLISDTDTKNHNLSSGGEVDYSQILDLATQLSEHDKKHVRFSVDGNLVKRLGEQLVAKKTTALSELIKNGYDADSTILDVFFENTDAPGGKITIIDNGNGMTKDALINGFMRISTSDKEENPISPKFERPRAGRKGIGRFSAQKIGDKLTIITRTSSEEPYNIVTINWNDYSSKKNLISISNSIEESFEYQGFEKGTKLVISETKEVWDSSNLVTTYKYICSIIKASPSRNKSGVIDPGFRPAFYIGSPTTGIRIISEDTELLSEADAIIEANINEEGQVSVVIKGIKDSKLDDSYILSTEKPTFLNSSNFKFKAHYFPLSRGTKKSHLQTYLRENGGVKLYRNNYYVAPYGERFNDWLALDDSSRRRVILPPHSNTNFIGNIDIMDLEGTLFEETSSREGLIENNSFEELRDTGYEVIKSAVMRIASARGKKITSNQYKFVPQEPSLEEKIQEKYKNINSIIEKFDKKSPALDKDTKNSSPVPIETITEADSTELKDSLEDFHELLQEMIDEKNIYRVLASTGLAIAEFTHEIQLYINNLMLVSRQLKRMISDKPDAVNLAGDMNSNIEMLVSYTDFFTETIRSNSRRAKSVLELRDVFKTFFDAMKPTIDRRGYDLKITFDGYDFWTKPIHISELSSVLMNLFTNACKAIVRTGNAKGCLFVHVTTIDDQHIIRFEDNGDGIPKANWGKVFNALFTTDTSANAYSSDVQQMRGMGLGLTITHDIISGVGGEVAVVEPSDGFSTCIQVIIPKAHESEVPENAY
ncbi:sensor histidine kinase [Aeromonas caviae]|uniref:sensor histidine kinase n=1 Tax=Aeromonas caviae TaxID=648 RepID=UPI002B4AA652|nr:sensor histidine kinase [Aeromonas caviae]